MPTAGAAAALLRTVSALPMSHASAWLHQARLSVDRASAAAAVEGAAHDRSRGRCVNFNFVGSVRDRALRSAPGLRPGRSAIGSRPISTARRPRACPCDAISARCGLELARLQGRGKQKPRLEWSPKLIGARDQRLPALEESSSPPEGVFLVVARMSTGAPGLASDLLFIARSVNSQRAGQFSTLLASCSRYRVRCLRRQLSGFTIGLPN